LDSNSLGGGLREVFSAAPTGPFKNPNGLSSYLTFFIPAFLSLAAWGWKNIFYQDWFIPDWRDIDCFLLFGPFAGEAGWGRLPV
jgi:hypothetical protein